MSKRTVLVIGSNAIRIETQGSRRYRLFRAACWRQLHDPNLARRE